VFLQGVPATALYGARLAAGSSIPGRILGTSPKLVVSCSFLLQSFQNMVILTSSCSVFFSNPAASSLVLRSYSVSLGNLWCPHRQCYSCWLAWGRRLRCRWLVHAKITCVGHAKSEQRMALGLHQTSCRPSGAKELRRTHPTVMHWTCDVSVWC
jgi:hypothetical protein